MPPSLFRLAKNPVQIMVKIIGQNNIVINSVYLLGISVKLLEWHNFRSHYDCMEAKLRHKKVQDEGATTSGQ